MPAVYVREQGAVVRKRGERLVVTKEDAELMEVPLVHVDQVVLMGNVQLTTQAVALLLQHEVDVVFFSQRGKFRGRLVQTGSKFARLRHAQLQVMSDEAGSLRIAREVVVGKLTNQRVLLQRQAARLASSPDRVRLEEAIRGIRAMLRAARGAPSLDSLRGYEGKGGAYYFGALRALIPSAFGFRGRAYHPPPDPANALLSFGYTLLLKDIVGAVQLVGLDPYLGFFHAIDYGRPSLALDVMEEFRPIIVDGMVLELIHTHVVTPQDFVWTQKAQRPVHMTDGAVEVLLERYEQRALTQVTHPVRRQQTTYRRCFEWQVRQVAGIVLGKRQQYQPVTIR